MSTKPVTVAVLRQEGWQRRVLAEHKQVCNQPEKMLRSSESTPRCQYVDSHELPFPRESFAESILAATNPPPHPMPAHRWIWGR